MARACGPEQEDEAEKVIRTALDEVLPLRVPSPGPTSDWRDKLEGGPGAEAAKRSMMPCAPRRTMLSSRPGPRGSGKRLPRVPTVDESVRSFVQQSIRPLPVAREWMGDAHVPGEW